MEQVLTDDINKSSLADWRVMSLIIVYAVGVVFIRTGWIPGFIQLTPLNLLFSAFMVGLAHLHWNIKTALALGIAFAAGLWIEMVGVATGMVFGEYAYGAVLGPKVQGTPWAIGLNWAMLVYCAGTTTNMLLSKRWSIPVKSLLGAALLVSLDILMEPVAIERGFWSWGGDGGIPLQNYLAWGGIGWTLLLVFHALAPDNRNSVAFVLLVLQFLFFFLLGC